MCNDKRVNRINGLNRIVNNQLKWYRWCTKYVNINNVSDTSIWLIIFKLRLCFLSLFIMFEWKSRQMICFQLSQRSQSIFFSSFHFLSVHCWSKTFAFRLLLTKLRYYVEILTDSSLSMSSFFINYLIL